MHRGQSFQRIPNTGFNSERCMTLADGVQPGALCCVLRISTKYSCTCAPANTEAPGLPGPADRYLCTVAPFLLEEELLLELVVGVILVPGLQELEPRSRDEDESATRTHGAPPDGSLRADAVPHALQRLTRASYPNSRVRSQNHM